MDPTSRLRTLGLCITLSVWGVMAQNTSKAGAPENCSPHMNCPANAKCVNNTHCTCLDGFQPIKDRVFTDTTATCDDINECLQPKPPDCGPNSHCENEPRSYHCACADGYASSSGKAKFMKASENDCQDVDECVGPNRTDCGPHANCTNLPGNYSCTCIDGYKSSSGRAKFMNASENDCRDDKCVGPNQTDCGPHANCTNVPGSYNCTCIDGYESSSARAKFMNASENDCQDVDECQRNTMLCEPHGNCINTPGSYMCKCKSGFGKSHKDPTKICKDIDECVGLNRADCGPHANCTNLPGNYSCTCIDGYKSSSGKANFRNVSENDCQDIDKCRRLNSTHPCGINATCINTTGSYECVCAPGYFSASNTPPCKELTFPQLLTGYSTETQALLGNLTAEVEQHFKKELSNLKQMKMWDAEAGKKMLEFFLGILDSQLNTSLWNRSMKQRHQLATDLMAMVEKVLRTLGLALPGGTTSLKTSLRTVSELGLAVRREGFQSQEAVILRHDNTQMELKWTAAEGQKIEGFTLAGLLTYQGLSPVLEGAEQVEAPEWDTIGQEKWWLRKPGRPSYRVVSEVVSAFVNDLEPQALNSSVNVILKFSHPVPESKEDQHILCAYWEPNGRHWSTEGCTRLAVGTNTTHCQCNHLSSFAVLMAFYDIEDWTLSVITKVGLVISLVCLLLSIVTFLFCRAIKGPRTTIHLHLCLSLFVAYVVFLTGAGSPNNKVACSVVAGLLHYFFLAAFCWMCVEGTELYLMVVQVFAPHSLRRRYMFLLGYGVPAIIVGISAAAYSTGYGTAKYCWLSRERAFLWSFLAPVCIIIAVNAVIFVVTVWKLAQKFTDINPDMGQLKKYRVLTITAIAQLCILGTTWIFGMFQFDHQSLVVSYIFTILNSLQGLFIFLLHCLLKRQVREEYCRWVCCSSLKYSEFSSSTASSIRKGLQPSQESGL